MSRRGVIYVYWGDQVKEELNKSIASLKRFHPELPYECLELPEGSTLLDKNRMAANSPFETTLFLDTDTVVMDRLDLGFEKAEKFNFACCINECPWARRYASISGDQIEYNTGVLFFTKSATAMFEAWANLSQSMDSSILFHREGKLLKMPHNDQAAFSQAIHENEINPFILPLNWNFRPQWHRTFFGPIKVWHDRAEVPDQVKFWNESQRLETSIIRYSEDGIA